MNTIATTPSPPYYAVIFTSQRTPLDDGYEQMARRMLELAATQAGFLGVESVRDGSAGGSAAGITVSYWESLESIANWRANSEHRLAQERGRNDWYSGYRVRIARVEREYGSAQEPPQ